LQFDPLSEIASVAYLCDDVAVGGIGEGGYKPQYIWMIEPFANLYFWLILHFHQTGLVNALDSDWLA
jgi:hypothetical protein